MRLFKIKPNEPAETTEENQPVVEAAMPTPTSRLARLLSSRKRVLLGVTLIIILIALVTGLVVRLHHRAAKTPDSKTAAAKLESDYEARKKAYEQVAATPQAQFALIKKQLSDQHVDLTLPVESIVKKYSTNQTVSDLILQAALLGAKAKDPDAKIYASIALEFLPKDASYQKAAAGLIDRLTAISKGDFSVANY